MANLKDRPSADELSEMLSSLYHEFAAYLVELAQRFGCSPDCAEDMVQDTFAVAVEKIDELYHSENRRGWLVLTLKYRIGTTYRSMQYAQKLLQDLKQLQSMDYEDQMKPEDLYSGLISEEELRLLTQFCVKGLPIKVLAEELKISEAACKKRIERAKQRFRKAYEQHVSKIR